MKITKLAAAIFFMFLLVGCNQSLNNEDKILLKEAEAQNNVDIKSETESEVVVLESDAEGTASPVYQKYAADFYQENLGKKPMALFFHASWCPKCRKLEKEISEDLSNFPDGSLILETNYDKESALKQKYGVTIQTTVIVLNASGEQTAKLLDPSLDALKSAIAESMKI